MALGQSIAVSMGVTGMVYFLLTNGFQYFPMVVTRIFKGMDSFVFICVPLYILAGDLMNSTGLTERLVRWARVVVGKLPGGLAQAQLVTTAVFGGISGSALGDIAALGTIFIPNLQKEGYGKDFACALTAASAVADPIIPPSIIIVIYAAVMNTSIGGMYAAAIIPGLLLILGDMVIVHLLAKKRNYPRRQEPVSVRELAIGTRDATLALIMPFIILGGIFLGIFTPTEAAAVAAAYALIVGIFIYRKMTLKEIPRVLFNAAYSSGTLFFVIACASILGWAFAMMQVPQQVLTLFSGLKDYPLAGPSHHEHLFIMDGDVARCDGKHSSVRSHHGPPGIFHRDRSDTLFHDLRHERQSRQYHSPRRDHPLCNAGGGKGTDGIPGQGADAFFNG